jgi:hypothetical protein
VLIISDQCTVGVRRKCGLSSSRKSEEDGNIAILAFVCGGVKGEDVVLDGHFVEEYSEDTLFHLSSVLGTKDNHLFLGKVDSN